VTRDCRHYQHLTERERSDSSLSRAKAEQCVCTFWMGQSPLTAVTPLHGHMPSWSHAARPVTFWMAGKQAKGEPERSCTPIMLCFCLHSQVFWKKGNTFCILATESGSLDKDAYHQYLLQSVAQPHSEVCIKEKEPRNTLLRCMPRNLNFVTCFI